MCQIVKKSLIVVMPILLAFLLFCVLLVMADYRFKHHLNNMINNLSFIDVETNKQLYLADIEDKMKLIVFYKFFDANCMFNRIELFKKISNNNNDDLKVIAVFYGDFKRKDIINFKKISELNFYCVLSNDESSEYIKKLEYRRGDHSVVINNLNDPIYYDKRRQKTLKITKNLIIFLNQLNFKV